MGWPSLRSPDWRLVGLWVALGLTCLAGWFFKDHCMKGGWTNAEQYVTGCYSDVIPFWDVREVKAGKVPYFQTPMEYPVLTGAQIWLEGGAARWIYGARARSENFLAAVTIVNTLLAALILWMMRHVGLANRRLWLWALAPPLVLYLGHNWDLGAVALAVAALVLARNDRLAAAAAMAGLGAAAKLFPVLLLPLIGLAVLFEPKRSWTERFSRSVRVTLAAIGAWAVVNLPVAIAAYDNWSEFYRFSQQRPGTSAASWELLSWAGLWVTTIPERNFYGSLLFVAGAGAIVAIGWRRHGAHPWTLFAAVLAWFMLTNKVYSPQFDLWLYPILLMLAPRLLPVLLFAAFDICAYFAEFWLFAGMEGGAASATPDDIALAAGLRAAAMLWIIADNVLRSAPAWVTRPKA